MVIEKIKDDEKEKFEEYKNKRNKIKEMYLNLIKEFNKEAKNKNCPLRMKFKRKINRYVLRFDDRIIIELFLPKKRFGVDYKKKISEISRDSHNDNLFAFGKDLDKVSDEPDNYYFGGVIGLDYRVFKAIEPTLNEIPQEFYIKLKNGKVPIRYKILDNLN